MSFRFLTKFDPLVKNYQVLRNHYDILKTTVQTSKNVLFRLKNKQRWWHKSRLVGAEPEVYPQVDFCQHKSANSFWVQQQTAMKLLQMLLYNSTKIIIETKNKLQPRYGIIKMSGTGRSTSALLDRLLLINKTIYFKSNDHIFRPITSTLFPNIVDTVWPSSLTQNVSLSPFWSVHYGPLWSTMVHSPWI